MLSKIRGNLGSLGRVRWVILGYLTALVYVSGPGRE